MMLTRPPVVSTTVGTAVQQVMQPPGWHVFCTFYQSKIAMLIIIDHPKFKYLESQFLVGRICFRRRVDSRRKNKQEKI